MSSLPHRGAVRVYVVFRSFAFEKSFNAVAVLFFCDREKGVILLSVVVAYAHILIKFILNELVKHVAAACKIFGITRGIPQCFRLRRSEFF